MFVILESVAHIGELKTPSRPRATTYGSGLFVSQCPQAWRLIAGLSGPLWKIHHPDRPLVFLDRLTIPMESWETFCQVAAGHGLLERTLLWRVEHQDAETGDLHWFEFTDEDKARVEATDRDSTLRCLETWGATPFFRGELSSRCIESHDPSMVQDEAVLDMLVQVDAGLDGIWWNERLDVARYSAPQGAIHPSRLDDLCLEPVDSYSPPAPATSERHELADEPHHQRTHS